MPGNKGSCSLLRWLGCFGSTQPIDELAQNFQLTVYSPVEGHARQWLENTFHSKSPKIMIHHRAPTSILTRTGKNVQGVYQFTIAAIDPVIQLKIADISSPDKLPAYSILIIVVPEKFEGDLISGIPEKVTKLVYLYKRIVCLSNNIWEQWLALNRQGKVFTPTYYIEKIQLQSGVLWEEEPYSHVPDLNKELPFIMIEGKFNESHEAPIFQGRKSQDLSRKQCLLELCRLSQRAVQEEDYHYALKIERGV